MSQEFNLEISDQDFERFSEFVRGNYGINLGKEKKSMVIGRLHGILSQQGIENFGEYFNKVTTSKNIDMVKTLLDKITTNHTFFMREWEHFEYFSKYVLPWIVDNNRERDFRIWSAGCSTGEEPYTLAMMISDYLGSNKYLWNTSILATDISTQALTKASKGIYPHEHTSKMPDRWKKEYFSFIDNENCVVSDKIKNDVVFRRFNLMDEEFPFKKDFQAIFCRNVMIYFNLETKIKLIRKYYEHTAPGGYLFIGQSETIPKEVTGYHYIMPSVYRK